MRTTALKTTSRVSFEAQGSGGGAGYTAPAKEAKRKPSRPRQPAAAPEEDPREEWGSPAQIAGAREALNKLVASRGARAAGTLLHRVAQRVQTMSPTAPEDPRLLVTVQSLCEGHWRRSVIADFVLRRLQHRRLFAAWKTLDLLHYDRTPAEVTEGFVRAAGNIGSTELVARDIFWQSLRPLSTTQTGLKPSGQVILIAPGLGETGRNFYDQAAQLNRLGHEVVLMDQQWAGQTRSVEGIFTSGALDSGFGAARDVGRMAEDLHRHLGKNQQLLLLGQGTGGSAILMLLVALAADQIETSLPRNLDAVLQAPYLAPTPSNTNRLIHILGRLPVGRNLSAKVFLPKPSTDQSASAIFAQCRQRDDVQVLMGTLNALRDDLRTMLSLLAQGYKPQGKIAVLHSADDPWADPAASFRLSREEVLGSHAAVRILSGAHHALGQVASERNEALWGLHKLGIGVENRA